MINPSRYTLLAIYTGIHNKLTNIGVKPKDIIDEKSRTLHLTEDTERIFKNTLSAYTLEEQCYLRVLNDQQRYFLGDDLMQVALVLNELLPRFRDLEIKEKKNYVEAIKLPPNTVITAGDLIFNHLASESPAYVRRLITSAVESGDYYMTVSNPLKKDIEEMENISANWILEGVKHDAEALKILSLLGTDGKPSELKDTDVGRFKYLIDLQPSLLKLSSFKRSDSAHFSRFIVLLPSILTWCLGNSNLMIMEAAEEDPLMDLLESVMTFTRVLQNNADQAAKIRQLIHHGFPVYKDLIELQKAQSSLMSWNFEGIIFRLAQNINVLLRDRKNETQVTKFLMASGILQLYSRHKDAYIKR